MKYDKKYPKMLVEHMSDGLSFESFGGVAEVKRSTLYRWQEKYPDFKDAHELGWTRCLLFYEKIGRQGMIGKLPGFNLGCWCFNMKNRFKWTDRVDHTSKEEKIDNPVNVYIPKNERD